MSADVPSVEVPSAEVLSVEVACALPEQQRVAALTVPVGCTAREAVRLAGLVQAFPSLDLDSLVLGLFGQRIEDDHVLADGDRVELYRPLLLDPKEARRQRAAKLRKR